MSEALKVIAGAPDRPLIIGDVEIQCYVLEDETRVISQRGLQAALGMGTGGSTTARGAPRIAAFVASLEQRGIDVNDLAASSQPIEFQPPGGGRTAYGYPATLLVDLCNAILSARDAGVLQKQQAHIAKQATVLIRALAGVAIIALVDEATGYQDIRAKNALVTILEKWIAEKHQEWTRTFPYEFYELLYKRRGWSGPDGHKRTHQVGRDTNDLVL